MTMVDSFNPTGSPISGSKLPAEYSEISSRLLELLRIAYREDMERGGEPRWYSGKFLAKFLGVDYSKIKINDIHVRAMVNHLRRNHYPILSSTKGYRYTKDLKDIKECIDNLRQRAGALQKAINGLMYIHSYICKTESMNDLFEEREDGAK